MTETFFPDQYTSDFDVHVCIVASGDVANVTPILDQRFRPKHVILLERKGMAFYGNNLVSVFHDVGVSCQRIIIDNVAAVDTIRKRVLQLLEESNQGKIALNASCGHRAIMLAAFSAFQQTGQPIFYVNPENDHLTWLFTESNSSYDLADQISIKQFLQLQGTTLVSANTEPVTNRLDNLFYTLITQVERFAAPFKVLNALAASARNTSLLSQPFSIQQKYNKGIQDLVDVFSDHGYLTRQRNQLIFPDEVSRNFVNGGWLELYAYTQIQSMVKIYPQIQDVARNVELSRRENSEEINNELDVVFLADNHLFLVECKTMDFAAIKGQMSFRKIKEKKRAAREQVYRLDSLKEQHGGLHGEAMVLSYHPLPKEVILRAEDLGLCICSSIDLLHFKSIIKDWALPEQGRIIEDAS